MDINEALSVFSLTDISHETKDTLKKIYRKLMIKYHPDSCDGSEDAAKRISLAYEILTEAMEHLDAYKRMTEILRNKNRAARTVVLTLSQLIRVYDGEVLDISAKEKDATKTDEKAYTKFSKADLKKDNVIIMSDVNIEHNGIKCEFSNVEGWNLGDKYEIYGNIDVDNIIEPQEVTIHLLNREKKVNIKSESIVMIFTLDHNIKVSVGIVKKLRKMENEEKEVEADT